MSREVQLQSFHQRLSRLSYDPGVRQLIFVNRNKETEDWVARRRVKTGGHVYFYSEIEKSLVVPVKSVRRMGRFIIAPSGTGKSYIKTKYSNFKDTKILDFDELVEAEIGWKNIDWRTKSGQNKLETFILDTISMLEKVTEPTTVLGSIGITDRILAKFKENTISVLGYVPSIEYHIHTFNLRITKHAKKGTIYHGPTLQEALDHRTHIEDRLSDITRIVRYNLVKFAMQHDDMRKNYWSIFHLTGRIGVTSSFILLMDFFDPLLVTMFERLGFTTCAAKGTEAVDYVHVILPGATKKWKSDTQGIYELDNFSSYPLASSGLGIFIRSEVFPDVFDADRLYQLNPERYFGRLVRNAVWAYVNYKHRKLLTLGSETESFALNKYFPDVNVIHVSSVEPPADMKVLNDKVQYHKTTDFMKDDFVFNNLTGRLVLGLFSISNIRNGTPRDAVRTFSEKTSNFIFSFPNRAVLNNWPNKFRSIWNRNGIMKQTSFKATYYDNSAFPEEFLGIPNAIVVTVRDLLVLMKADTFGNKRKDTIHIEYDLNDPFSYLWFFVIGRDFIGTKLQTWFNSQTHFARYVSIPLRNDLNLWEDSLHIVRAKVFEMLYFDVNPKIIRSTRVNGSYINKQGKLTYVSVSGHLTNLLMYSGIGLIDFRRYIDTIESNLRIVSGVEVNAKERYYLVTDLLAEDNVESTKQDLWHSYDDFYCAVATYLFICRITGMKVNARAVIYVMYRLNDLRHRYWKFSTASYDALEYIKEIGEVDLD